jgi:hypothetical protein
MRTPAIALVFIATPALAEPGFELGIRTRFGSPMGKLDAKWTRAMRIALGALFVLSNACGPCDYVIDIEDHIAVTDAAGGMPIVDPQFAYASASLGATLHVSCEQPTTSPCPRWTVVAHEGSTVSVTATGYQPLTVSIPSFAGACVTQTVRADVMLRHATAGTGAGTPSTATTSGQRP